MSETLKEDATLAKNNSKKPSFLIGVRIEGAAKSKLYDPGKQNYRVGSRVVVESDYGGQMGIIVSNKIPNVIKTESKTYRVLRTFNKNDIQVQTRKNETEKRAKKVCQEIIKKF